MISEDHVTLKTAVMMLKINYILQYIDRKQINCNNILSCNDISQFLLYFFYHINAALVSRRDLKTEKKHDQREKASKK